MTQQPQQAVENLLGEQFIEWLTGKIGAEVKSWPVLTLVQAKNLRPEKVRKFMFQLYLADQAIFGGKDQDPGFLGFAIANLSESNDPLAESSLALLEKKREEASGNRQRHESWLKILKALGITDDEIKRAEPKEPTRNYIAELSDVYSNWDWPSAAAAFTALIWAIDTEQSYLAQMADNLKISQVNDMEWLRLHSHTDTRQDGIVHALDKIVFDKDNKELVWNGTARFLEIRKEFLQGLSKYLEDKS